MKKLFTLFAMMFLLVGGLFAQKLSYQAVVRDNDNKLVVNTALTVEVSILNANNGVQYAETHNATSNQNGLIVLTIGEGTVTSGTNLSAVNWEGATINSVIKNGNTTVATISSPVNAVPYALQAANASGSFSQVQADWAETNTASKAYIANKPDLSSFITTETDPTVPTWAKATTKPAYSYNEISGTPDLSNYLTQESDPTVPAWAKATTKPAYSYNEISGTPDLSNYLTQESDPTVPAWAKAANKPAYSYNEITGTPDLSNYLTQETDPTVNNGTLTIKQGTQVLGTFTANNNGDVTVEIPTQAIPDQVKSDWNATSGPAEILNKPTIPTAVAQLTDAESYVTDAELAAAGYLTSYTETDPTVPAWAKATSKPTYGYDEITGTPDLSNYLTQETDPSVPAWAKATTKPTYDYSEIQNTPAIPAAQVQADWAEDNTASMAYIANKPAIPANTSDLNNDAGFITAQDITGYATQSALNDSVADLKAQMNQISSQLNQLMTALTALQVTSKRFVVSQAAQAEFNLGQAINGEIVCYVNGVMVGSKTSGVVTVNANNIATYLPAQNYGYELQVGDVVTFMYIANN